ncbi:PilN domain-containing protein [Nisaea sediminum]|uniref:PilN domain-containing protein n=1 Tax=Nisaea sediminum TaxID=2775867 RepID=UPI0018672B85|nr:PilN domain-containing protein [Nisaea sediminum]
MAGLPPRFRTLFGRSVTIVEPVGDGFLLFAARGGNVQPKGTASTGDLSKHLAALGSPVALVMPAADRVNATLSVPASARRSLGSLLDGEVERLTPFKRGEVRLAYDLLEERDGKLRIRLYVVPRTRLEAAVRQFESAGGGAPALMLAGAEQVRAPSAFDFNGSPVTAQGRRGLFWPTMAALSILLALLSPLPKPYFELQDVSAEIDQLRGGVAAVQEARGALDRHRQLAERLQAVLAAEPDVPTLLEAVTMALPDDAWLTGFEVRPGRLTLEGFARDASGLLEKLEAMPGMTEVAFEAPVTRDPAGGGERFRIGAALETRGR